MYQDYRCNACKKLMFKGILVESAIEVKCRSCGNINTFQGISREKLLCLKEGCPGRVKIEERTKLA